jgi:hypothetical protein
MSTLIRDAQTGMLRPETDEEKRIRIDQEAIEATRNANPQLQEGTSSGAGGGITEDELLYEIATGAYKAPGPIIAAKPKEIVNEFQRTVFIETAMKQLGLLHKPAEILKISSVLYYSQKQEENLINLRKATENQNNAISNAEKNMQTYWDYMYAMLTRKVEDEIQVIPVNHKGDYVKGAAKPLENPIELYKTTYELPQADKQHIADLYMNYNFEIEMMKIHYLYPFLSLEELEKV